MDLRNLGGRLIDLRQKYGGQELTTKQAAASLHKAATTMKYVAIGCAVVVMLFGLGGALLGWITLGALLAAQLVQWSVEDAMMALDNGELIKEAPDGMDATVARNRASGLALKVVRDVEPAEAQLFADSTPETEEARETILGQVLKRFKAELSHASWRNKTCICGSGEKQKSCRSHDTDREQRVLLSSMLTHQATQVAAC